MAAPRHSPLERARLRGRAAARAGGSIADCPYPDKRTQSGRLTWSRAFRRAWMDGFAEVINPQADMP
ncbi:MAG TPA: hypothetical protein DEH78_05190, partial [Solibacterales bacterium]|nr:hypothetical protein [Bryobacterales bacterium]